MSGFNSGLYARVFTEEECQEAYDLWVSWREDEMDMKNNLSFTQMTSDEDIFNSIMSEAINAGFCYDS